MSDAAFGSEHSFRHGEHLHKSVEAQTGRASALLIATLLGGVLVLTSFIANWLWGDYTMTLPTGGTLNAYRDGIALIGALLLGVPLVWHAVSHLLLGEMHMDELVALAIVAAIAIGAYQEAGLVAFFMIVSTLIETRTALGARASIEALIKITPTSARLVQADGSEIEVDPRQLTPGDTIRIRPGDNIPSDGEVITGESTVNQATITGESLPVDKAPGEEVFAGTINLTGALDVRVTKEWKDNTLQTVRDLISNAEMTKIPLMRLIDQYAMWYTPTILMIAGIVFFFTQEWDRAISILVVSCPCALILATPTAMVAALSAAARLGVLVKNVVHLEWARGITAIVFDKTGTLTTGELSVTSMKPAPGVDGAELLKVAASVEQMSRHPVARAVVAVAEKAKLRLDEPSDFEEVSGRGVCGRVDGETVRVGRSAWLAEHGADLSLLKDPEYKEPEGVSMLYVTRGTKCLGWLGLEDRTRPEARRAIDDLRKLGTRELIMVTGDRWSVARRVAKEMGCSDVHAEVLPDQKLELVDQLKAKGHRVAVVGDGVNDAPALAAGDLGIAMGAAGSDVAIHSASIALMSNDLGRLPFLVRLSRAATNVIWQNMLFGVTFIVVTVALGSMGMIKPMLAALLHLGASSLVVFNSARLIRSGEELAPHAPERERASGHHHEHSVADSLGEPQTA
ncbi:MAG: cation-translocating P-type ATPase [Phycisphaerae bacterium]|nr:cation-translocating P-type ATPase [Phycisphaerae bacterium]